MLLFCYLFFCHTPNIYRTCCYTTYPKENRQSHFLLLVCRKRSKVDYPVFHSFYSLTVIQTVQRRFIVNYSLPTMRVILATIFSLFSLAIATKCTPEEKHDVYEYVSDWVLEELGSPCDVSPDVHVDPRAGEGCSCNGRVVVCP